MSTPEQRKFQELSEQIKTTRSLVYSTDKKVSQIVDILKGDDFGGYAGIVKQVEENKSRIQKLEETNKKVGWTFGGMSIVSGYGLWEIFKKIFGS